MICILITLSLYRSSSFPFTWLFIFILIPNAFRIPLSPPIHLSDLFSVQWMLDLMSKALLPLSSSFSSWVELLYGKWIMVNRIIIVIAWHTLSFSSAFLSLRQFQIFFFKCRIYEEFFRDFYLAVDRIFSCGVLLCDSNLCISIVGSKQTMTLLSWPSSAVTATTTSKK